MTEVGMPLPSICEFQGLRVLCVGPADGTALHKVRALQRLGCDVRQVDPEDWLPWRQGLSKLLIECRAGFLDPLVASALRKHLGNQLFSVAFVVGGALLGPRGVEVLQGHADRVVNFNHDNPFASRDKHKWQLYLKGLRRYDLVVVVREENLLDAAAAGARDIMLVSRTADEVAHAPPQSTSEERARYASEVAFVGTWMPERGPFLAELIDRGVPLSIWGDRWRKGPEWHRLRGSWRGPGVYSDEEYAAAILGSKVCLGLLSKGNRDHVTTRSFEVPALGTLLCAERTDEHLELYKDREEAVFWRDAKECAEQCAILLANDEVRRAIARAGHKRCLRNGHFNEPMLARVLRRALEPPNGRENGHLE